MKLGSKIQEVRKRLGITQSELGRRLGVSGSMVGQWESNRRTPKYETTARIARALDVSVEELFGLLDDVSLDETTDLYRGVKEFGDAITSAHHIRAIEFAESTYGRRIIDYFRMLNEDGRQEAAKRVFELCYIPEYTGEISTLVDDRSISTDSE